MESNPLIPFLSCAESISETVWLLNPSICRSKRAGASTKSGYPAVAALARTAQARIASRRLKRQAGPWLPLGPPVITFLDYGVGLAQFSTFLSYHLLYGLGLLRRRCSQTPLQTVHEVHVSPSFLSLVRGSQRLYCCHCRRLGAGQNRFSSPAAKSRPFS